jgi:hypothetical protein
VIPSHDPSRISRLRPVWSIVIAAANCSFKAGIVCGLAIRGRDQAGAKLYTT